MNAALPDGLAPPATSRAATVIRLGPESSEVRRDRVAEEVPVALEFNGVSHAVMLATPSDLEDFALGFSLSEAIVGDAAQVYGIEAEVHRQGITLHVEIASECFVALKERRRTLAGRTGCGLCGVDSLDQVIREQVAVLSTTRLEVAALLSGFAGLIHSQALMQLTGAVHGAAWMDRDGQIGCVREDVGRHNALDKMLGAAVAAGVDRGTGAALITSRASFEMVQKSVELGVPVLAAISAPTALALRRADALGMTLAGFVRGERLVCYSHGERLVQRVPELSA